MFVMLCVIDEMACGKEYRWFLEHSIVRRWYAMATKSLTFVYAALPTHVADLTTYCVLSTAEGRIPGFYRQSIPFRKTTQLPVVHNYG